MPTIAVISYLTGGLLFLTLAVLLATSWRGRLQGALLMLATLVSAAWCFALAWAAKYGAPHQLLFAAEILRNAAWLTFLLGLLGAAFPGGRIWRSRHLIHGFWVILLVAGLLPLGSLNVVPGVVLEYRAMGLLIMALGALLLVEQIYRNAGSEQRWAVKFLCLGAGGMFAYDLILYADALMFLRLDADLWTARGAINAMVVPLLAISAARNPQWSLDVFVSRRFVFYGATLAGAGLVLLVMAAGGYYVRLYGGEWGTVAQVIVVSATLLGLLVLLFSGQVRARLKVFLSKHFYNYRYDYRDEWLRFIGTLAEGEPGPAMRQRVIQALAQIVDSTNGRLWVSGEDERAGFVYAADWNRAPPVEVIARDDPLLVFLRGHNWVIDLNERAAHPERYPGLELPVWLERDAGAWLVIPLRHHEELTAIVLLGTPRAPRETNWEDRDLLKTAGQQAAGYLALLSASEALSQARQFEAFNRLSAYVVHDLKNMVAQLALVVANAQRHRDNPAFMEDAIGTVDNAVGRMNRLLAQLRKARFEAPEPVPVRLDRCLGEVVARRGASLPRPVLVTRAGADATVLADPQRLGLIVEHLVQNAQEATGPDGRVEVFLDRVDDLVRVRIGDDGVGMDAQFIRERLFRPFDTTKGNAGMGIGVYEAREFVQGLGGRVEVESSPGQGTTFTLLFPAARADTIDEADAPGAESGRSDAPGAATSSAGGAT